MEIYKFCYRENSGWSEKIFPNLDSDRTAIFVFSAPEFHNQNEIINQLVSAYPKSKIIGCSGAGQIYGRQIIDRGLSVAVVRFEKTEIKFVSMPIDSVLNSFNVGLELALKMERPDLCGLFVLTEGLSINGSAFVQGLNSKLEKNVVVTGGLAGDGADFKKTWVLNNGKAESNIVTALGFYGKNLKIGYGSKGGWDIFGPERIVTKSKDNILYELDEKPALKLYKEYLGEKASGLPATALLFPLQIRTSDFSGSQYVRTILAIDEKEQSMIFAGDIPVGSKAQLMRANIDRLIDGASAAAGSKTLCIHTQKMLMIAISCIGRRLVLGERAEEEIEATLEKFPSGTEQLGFYSYGEISPISNDVQCELHNQTMTLTTFSED